MNPAEIHSHLCEAFSPVLFSIEIIFPLSQVITWSLSTPDPVNTFLEKTVNATLKILVAEYTIKKAGMNPGPDFQLSVYPIFSKFSSASEQMNLFLPAHNTHHFSVH